MKMLAMDTTTLVMGVAVLEEGKVLGEITTNLLKKHSVRLMPTVDHLLKDLDLQIADIDALAVTSGPGSYTGIRIGVTTAKTIAWARKIPLYSDSSLTVLAMNGLRFSGLVVPLFDARRQRVYTGVYRPNNQRLTEVLPQQVMPLDDLLVQLAQYDEPVLFLGDDGKTFQEKIVDQLRERAIMGEPSENIPRPSQLGWLAWQKMKQGIPSASEAISPNYLQLTQAEANLLQQQGNGESMNGERTTDRISANGNI